MEIATLQDSLECPGIIINNHNQPNNSTTHQRSSRRSSSRHSNYSGGSYSLENCRMVTKLRRTVTSQGARSAKCRGNKPNKSKKPSQTLRASGDAAEARSDASQILHRRFIHTSKTLARTILVAHERQVEKLQKMLDCDARMLSLQELAKETFQSERDAILWLE